MRHSIAAALAMTVITLTPPAFAQEQTLKVIASFSILADLVRNVAGDRVEITTLVGPDGDAHAYEASPADAARLAGADIVFMNGAGLEGFLPRLVQASATKAPVIELTKGVELMEAAEEEEHDHEGHGHDDGHHHHGDHDPHAWQSVANAEIYVGNIADALCAADADGCSGYRANAERYGADLKALDEEIRSAVASIPQDRRKIISSHDAFGYFEQAYGIDFIAVEGVSTDAEASAADVAALIRQVREDGAAAIFVENISDPRLVQRIADETGLKVGGELYSDALSGPDGPASTYIDMMRHNIATIRAAVTGG